MQVQILLAIECSSELCSVALQQQLSSQTKLTYRSALAPREHAYLVLPYIEELLEESGLQFSDLQGIAFGQGPGAFTGLRVAASMAQGLALAHDIPLFAACSLETLARQVMLDKHIYIISVLDARMSELYWAVYEKGADEKLTVIKEANLSSAEDLMQAVMSLNLSQAAYFIGPGCRHLISFLNENNCLNISIINQSMECFPHASDLLSSVNYQLVDQVSKTAELPMPVYVRNDVAAKSKKPLV